MASNLIAQLALNLILMVFGLSFCGLGFYMAARYRKLGKLILAFAVFTIGILIILVASGVNLWR
jgi:hypothetical protein